MANIKLDILWSPHHDDKFVTFSNEINLHQVNKGDSTPIEGSKTSYATVVSINSDIQYIKCASWYCGSDPPYLLAVGQNNGKLVLVNLVQNGKDPYCLDGKEFVPPHRRQCNALAWNPIEHNLLAEGLDKSRTDHPICIWDVNAKPSPDLGMHVTPDRQRYQTSSTDFSTVTRPVLELGQQSESCFSLCWFQRQSVVAGMNKCIRIFDLRDRDQREQMVTQTKSVCGLCIDPQNRERMASYFEGQVSFWDIRAFDKPVLTFQESKHVIKLEWCPTRVGLLGSLTKDSHDIKLYDVHHAFVGNDELDPMVSERLVQPGGHKISSFTWNSSQESNVVAVSTSGSVQSVKVFERISLYWSGQELAWSCGRLMNFGKQESEPLGWNDISVEMKHRAVKGYGLQSEQVWQNAEPSLIGDNLQLQTLWKWIDLVRSLWHEEKLKPPQNKTKRYSRFYGIKSIIWGDANEKVTANASDVVHISWQGMEGKGYAWKPLIYRSEERSKALLLCGWGFERDDLKLNTLLNRLQSEGLYERAAAIALFNLRLKMCLQILNHGASKLKTQGNGINLGVVAMALSGFSGDSKNSLWQDMCRSLLPKIEQPYIKAMFSFLTMHDGDNGKFDGILMEKDLLVQDKVAFACMFLNDTKLCEVIENLENDMIETGNLQGVLITGLTSDGVALLQKYVDHTGDVQTAAIAIIQAFPSDISRDSRVENWIESYRTLLDSWRLWHHRAEFDVFHRSRNTTSPITQVYVSCNFCGKSVSSKIYDRRQPLHFMYQGGPAANKSKITSCPGCRKPLPRCSLCLVNMGTAAGSARQIGKKGVHGDPLAPLSNWFTWCQTCRHGGHAEHITEWFSDHQECPVSGCSCKCMTVDSMAKVNTLDVR